MEAHFARRMASMVGPGSLGLAVSGGVDSMALADLIARWARPRGARLRAYIVDHRLRSESTIEAHAVKDALAEIGVRGRILSLEPPPKIRIEEWARNARRKAFRQACKEDGVEQLLLAQHWDDQAELFVLRLLGGSSWTGLAGMRPKTPLDAVAFEGSGTPALHLLRPLLDLRKSDLINWCRNHNIKWWEDATNADVTLTQRNLVRRFLTLSLNPPELEFSKLQPTLNLLMQQRSKCESAARRLYLDLLGDGYLTVNPMEGRASLRLLNAPTAILSALLYRIVAPLSPLNGDKLSMGAHKLDKLAKNLEGDGNLLGVEHRFVDGQLEFQREMPRRAELDIVHVYSANSEWSDWTVIDNRWKLRWRSEEPREFTVRFVKNPQAYLEKKPEKGVLQQMQRHPLFTGKNGQIIGFPTLGIQRGLEVEIMPKVVL